LGTKFNPLIFSGLDFTGTAGTQYMKAPVATEASLPTVGNLDGDARVTLDTDYVWIWNNATTRWINTGVKSANAGSSPNASGYSITDTNVGTNRTERQLVLQPADSSNPGILSTAAQNIAGDKTFDNNVIVTGDLTVNGTTTTVNTTVLDIEDANITMNNGGSDASAEGSGITVERTGTDGSLVYEDALASKWKAGAVGSEVELANISSTQTLTNKTVDGTTATGSNTVTTDADQVTYERADGSKTDIQAASDDVEAALSDLDDNKLQKLAGDLNEDTFSLADNQAVAANVTGLAFANGVTRGAKIEYTVVIDATADLYEKGMLEVVQRGADWVIARDFTGDDSLVDFDITAAGQIQYTTPAYAGFVSGTMKFRAQTLSA
jgi:hypothetical protein